MSDKAEDLSPTKEANDSGSEGEQDEKIADGDGAGKEGGASKRKHDEEEDDLKDDDDDDEGEVKKLKITMDEDGGPAPVYPSKEGTSFFNDADVLSGRGGGTNVHPGNRQFRDLINLHRRSYLKARKNDKPAISRAIVRAIRENNGRFLKKDDKSGLWFEIGDDAAREKTSQALRQRAPEMRKLLFDTEREEARVAAQEHLRNQRMLMGVPPDMQNGNGGPGMPPGMFPTPAFMAMTAGKNGGMPPMPPGMTPEQYSQMFASFMSQQQASQQPEGADGDKSGEASV